MRFVFDVGQRLDLIDRDMKRYVAILRDAGTMVITQPDSPSLYAGTNYYQVAGWHEHMKGEYQKVLAFSNEVGAAMALRFPEYAQMMVDYLDAVPRINTAFQNGKQQYVDGSGDWLLDTPITQPHRDALANLIETELDLT